jgi:ABC-type molybdate transport system ATPase subunit
VRLVCSSLVVLDFGKVIASGPTAEILQRSDVAAAYLGDDVAAEKELEDIAARGARAPVPDDKKAGEPHGR